MISDKQVTAVNGVKIPITAETICIHGDGKNAVGFAETISRFLKGKGIEIKAA